MGKPRQQRGNGASQEEDGQNPDGTQGISSSSPRWVRLIVSVILGAYLLVFAALSLSYYGRMGNHNQLNPAVEPQAEIQASFFLRKPLSEVNASRLQLAVELQDEVAVPNTTVVILEVYPLPAPNCTGVVFGVLPEPSNNSILPADLSILRETLVEIFLKQSVNLSLSPELFGKVYGFEVLAFPGGITVVPKQSGFPLQVLVLFNFSLHENLSHIDSEFTQFKRQLTNGINLKANESLFVELTNPVGSTVKDYVIVQISIMPQMGWLLPTPRLKQLAKEIIKSPRHNLGLDHTVFGRVKQIKLSSILGDTLLPPSPSPSPSSSPSPSPRSPPGVRAPSSYCKCEKPHPSYSSPSSSPSLSPSPSPCPHYPLVALPPRYCRCPPRSHAYSYSPAFISPAPAPYRKVPADLFTLRPKPLPPSQNEPSSSPLQVPDSSPSPSPLHHGGGSKSVSTPKEWNTYNAFDGPVPAPLPDSSAWRLKFSMWILVVCLAVTIVPISAYSF